MRKIDEQVRDAVFSGKDFSGGNTVVTQTQDDKTECILHGYKIFQLDRKTNKFKWNDFGWTTKTTSDRLNACFDAIYSLTGQQYTYFSRNGVGKVFNITSTSKNEVKLDCNF